jgi:hypothetical protein
MNNYQNCAATRCTILFLPEEYRDVKKLKSRRSQSNEKNLTTGETITLDIKPPAYK